MRCRVYISHQCLHHECIRKALNDSKDKKKICQSPYCWQHEDHSILLTYNQRQIILGKIYISASLPRIFHTLIQQHLICREGQDNDGSQCGSYKIIFLKIKTKITAIHSTYSALLVKQISGAWNMAMEDTSRIKSRRPWGKGEFTLSFNQVSRHML